jgi:UDP:flavonoid glycosyltransferase YjiC (YdhE family)
VSAVVAELVRRGHEVRVHTGARFHERFAGLGARVVPWEAARDFDADDLSASFPEAAGSPRREVMALVKQGFLGTAPGQVRDLRAELAREPADVLVGDSMCLGPGLVGELTGLPWATLNVLPFNPTDRPVPTGLPVPPMTGPVGRVRDMAVRLGYRLLTLPFHRVYQRVRAEVGLPKDRGVYGERFVSDWLVLATGCPGLEPYGVPTSRQVHHVGLLGLAGVDLPPPPDGLGTEGPLVLVSQGTIDTDASELLQPALAGLADQDVRVLATSGRRGVTEVGVPVPANAAVTDLVDFDAVLPRASVFVTNGGWGGVLAALAAGVPVVVAPGRAADKPYIAKRVAAAGAGVDLRRRRPTAEQVTAAVRTVLEEPSFTRKARELSAELAGCGGVRMAADLLETLATTRTAVLGTGRRSPG